MANPRQAIAQTAQQLRDRLVDQLEMSFGEGDNERTWQHRERILTNLEALQTSKDTGERAELTEPTLGLLGGLGSAAEPLRQLFAVEMWGRLAPSEQAFTVLNYVLETHPNEQVVDQAARLIGTLPDKYSHAQPDFNSRRIFALGTLFE